MIGLLLSLHARAGDMFDKTGDVVRGLGGSCTGDCCRAGSNKPGRACTTEYYMYVPSGLGDGQEVLVYLIQRRPRNDDEPGAFSLWGLADANASELLPAVYEELVVLNARLAFATRDGEASLVRPGGVREPSDITGVRQVGRPDRPPHFFGETPAGSAPLRADGTWGAPIADLRELELFGDRVVATAGEGPAARSTVIDAAGAVVWSGPRVRVHSTAYDSLNPPRVGVSEVVGPDPLRLDETGQFLYFPLNDRFERVTTPGLEGAVPLLARPDPEDPSGPFLASAWLFVVELEGSRTYRVGRGTAPAEMVAPSRWSTLAAIDRIEVLKPASPHANPAQAALLALRRAGTEQWVAGDWFGEDVTNARFDDHGRPDPRLAAAHLAELRAAARAPKPVAVVPAPVAVVPAPVPSAGAPLSTVAPWDRGAVAGVDPKAVQVYEGCKGWDGRLADSCREAAEDAVFVLGQPYVGEYVAREHEVGLRHLEQACAAVPRECDLLVALALRKEQEQLEAEHAAQGLKALGRALEVYSQGLDVVWTEEVTWHTWEDGHLVTHTKTLEHRSDPRR